MSDEDKDDREHEPSEQKLRRAREKGDVPRSAEITTALSYLGFTGAFSIGLAVLVPAWVSMAERLLAGEIVDPDGAGMPRGVGARSRLGDAVRCARRRSRSRSRSCRP